jgi:hypothetical protein
VNDRTYVFSGGNTQAAGPDILDPPFAELRAELRLDEICSACRGRSQFGRLISKESRSKRTRLEEP